MGVSPTLIPADAQHGTIATAQHAFRDGTDNQPSPSAQAVRGHDYEICRAIVLLPNDHRNRLSHDRRYVVGHTLQGSVSDGAQGQGAQAGVVFNRDGNRIYLTERVTDSRVDKTQTTIVGGETPWGERGAGKLYTEHQSEQNAQNARDMALVGAQRNWDVTPGLRLTLGGEYGTGKATAGSIERYALATGVSYASTTGWSVATRNELRREFGAQSLRQFLTTNQGELKITPDYTGLVKLRYSITSGPLVSTTTAEFAEYTLGLAYRPVSSDRFNALARYNHLLDRRAMVNGRAPQDMTRDILGAEWTYDLTRRISWVDKTAYRITTEGFVGRPRFTGHTWLSLHRLNFHVRRNIDLSQEYRLLVQQETHTQRQGWLSEIAWLPTPHFRLGLGFNFTDFTDSDYAPDNYSIHGWFLRFQGMQ